MSHHSFQLKGNLVDIPNKVIFPAEIVVQGTKIISIIPLKETCDTYILPGFIDAHVHIESSMLIPSEFARMASIHGTVATVSDPHEIANVCGSLGIKFMIENGKKTCFKFYFGAPSCVPATSFETAGALINSDQIKHLLDSSDIFYLAEMMNFPGVLNKDTEVLKKIEHAKNKHKPVDGHAPGLRGEKAHQYIKAGISTDHECFSYEEALEKLKFGMKVIIREGSAAKNFNALYPLIDQHYQNLMFCSDDKHPDSLEEGHINKLCQRSVALDQDVFKVLTMACVNPVHHYKLDVGLCKVNDDADFIVVKDLKNFDVLSTYIKGQCVAACGKTHLKSCTFEPINTFNCHPINKDAIKVPYQNQKLISVIEALDGELITHHLKLAPKIENQTIVSDLDRDILKIVVVNRYQDTKPAVSFIKNFGLKKGAIAGSIAHDSHNIICVGTSDADICEAINAIIWAKGGITFFDGEKNHLLKLPVAGLMTGKDGFLVAKEYTQLDQLVKKHGTSLHSPFMTLSFMALLVIPSIKLSDKGLFDADNFKFITE